MVRLMPLHTSDNIGCSIPLAAVGLFVSVSALVALCAKHSSHAAKKYTATTTNDPKNLMATPSRSPLPSPRKFLTTISNKATSTIPFIYKKKGGGRGHESDREKDEEEDKGGFGEGGLWQKTILMGEKCQPPAFSGVIFYDGGGKRVSEPPRSPRVASPFPRFSSTGG